jgi:hypothetical protein
MAEPILQDIFGPNATQDDNTLTIAKADLAAVGLTAQANNTGEALLAAIIKLSANTLTGTNQLTNPDQHCVLQVANSNVWESPYGTKLRQNVLISFDNDFLNPGLTPDNY